MENTSTNTCIFLAVFGSNAFREEQGHDKNRIEKDLVQTEQIEKE